MSPLDNKVTGRHAWPGEEVSATFCSTASDQEMDLSPCVNMGHSHFWVLWVWLTHVKVVEIP